MAAAGGSAGAIIKTVSNSEAPEPTVVLWHILLEDTAQPKHARVSSFLVRKGLDIRLQRSERCIQVGPVLLESHDNRVQTGSEVVHVLPQSGQKLHDLLEIRLDASKGLIAVSATVVDRVFQPTQRLLIGVDPVLDPTERLHVDRLEKGTGLLDDRHNFQRGVTCRLR